MALVRAHLPLREHPVMEWNNSCNFSQILRDQSQPWTIPSLLWTVCFGLILVVAIIGNCSVLWIVLGLWDLSVNYQPTGESIPVLLLAHKEMWTVTNYFLLSLTISDLLISTLNCIPSFIFMRDQ